MLVIPNINYGLLSGNNANGIIICHIETSVAPADAHDNMSKW